MMYQLTYGPESPSFGSTDLGAKGREFKIASTSIKIVSNSSYVARALDRFFTNRVFADFTADSQSPPKCGDRDGMNENWNPVTSLYSIRAFVLFFFFS